MLHSNLSNLNNSNKNQYLWKENLTIIYANKKCITILINDAGWAWNLLKLQKSNSDANLLVFHHNLPLLSADLSVKVYAGK